MQHGNPFDDTINNLPQNGLVLQNNVLRNNDNYETEQHVQLEMNSIYSGTGTAQTFPVITRTELNRRQTELNKLKEELNRREHGNDGNLPPPNNWPPFSDQSCFQPCFYQDINSEISLEYQAIVRNLFSVWKLYIMTLFGNVIGGFIILFGTGKAITLILSIVNCLLLTPVSYLCWFRPAYNAFRINSNLYFIFFFIGYLFQIQVTIYQTIGIPDTGNCGFELAINEFSLKSFCRVFFGLILFKIALCFAMCSLANVVMLIRVFNMYRMIRSKRHTERPINPTVRINN